MFSRDYPATLTPNGEGGYIVTFRDVPEAITEIWDKNELKETATDCLVTAVDFYIEDHRLFPAPSKTKKDDVIIQLPISISAKILLLNTMVSGNIRPVDLAKKMGIKPQEVNRIIDTGHTTKIDTIAKALSVLGKNLQLSI
ncbi:MAG: type II toxin-antitoxin system HicB family antitoxin [Inconstantimicrobium porci]|jgi:antitoxin HicB|uniref:type II toxin-antitoxin system HicB family antitoxin n=1 Tax=Inconstantimicrobium porci TaxID=2652291 RepID=UPI002A920EC0|nr:type II toxin-antitoxin system HicB family antitoxin [Inconstantimicrobium porci]MDY5910615.1 type II toxin-antitoxin system HicB family antitoxin [Inconstantimicrobium porci]